MKVPLYIEYMHEVTFMKVPLYIEYMHEVTFMRGSTVHRVHA